MNKHFYPNEWREVAFAVKEANDWRCQVCGVQCRRPGELWLGWRYTLTIAHWDRNYEAPAAFVVAACLPCHFLHDCRHAWHARRRAERWRRQIAGQLEIFPARG